MALELRLAFHLENVNQGTAMCNREKLNCKSLRTEELPPSTESLDKTDAVKGVSCTGVENGNDSGVAEVKADKDVVITNNNDKLEAGKSNSSNKVCNQSCKCCNKNKKENKEDPLNGYYIVWLLFAFLAFASFAIPMWKNADEISWWLTFIGLATLFISLCAYFYDNFISDKEPSGWVRALKVLGDLGAAVIVFGTFKLLAVNWGSLEKALATLFTVVILILTAYKAKKDI